MNWIVREMITMEKPLSHREFIISLEYIYKKSISKAVESAKKKNRTLIDTVKEKICERDITSLVAVATISVNQI